VLRNKDQTDLIGSINHIANGLPRFVYQQLTEQISPENAVTIIEFIKCQKTESNLLDSTKSLVIRALITLVKYIPNRNFKKLTRVDIINYLDSLRKPEETDPTHGWIGTYNLKRQLFLKFFSGYITRLKKLKKEKFQKLCVISQC
jgi:hypothetical protein